MTAALKNSPLERILGRVDDLDSVNLTILVQRLARERHLLETVFNTVQEGIFVIDRTGLIEYSNKAANRLIGLKEQEVGNVVLWKIMPDLPKSLRMRSESGSVESVMSHEIEITYPEYRFVRLYIVPFNVPQLKEEERLIIVLWDITEDRISTEELIESEKLSSIFTLAAGVAHELGNPLNSIHIHLQLIEREMNKLPSAEREKISSSLSVCMSEVNRLDGIIRNFLEAIRPAPPDFQEENLWKSLAEILQFQKKELEDLGIQVVVEFSGSLPNVLVDKNQVKQVFFNVIKNAMDAMGKGGVLQITASSDDQYVWLNFADSGEGITQEDLSNVFEPYFSTKQGGHGLGMMIVQRIMREHGGKIGLDSQREKGTVVTLQFPRKNRRFRLLKTEKKKHDA